MFVDSCFARPKNTKIQIPKGAVSAVTVSDDDRRLYGKDKTNKTALKR